MPFSFVPRLLVIVVVAVLVAAPATAQQQRYSTWSDSSTTTAVQPDRLQELVDKLLGLVDEAEKARAADPRFLRDLRDLARGYHRPWRKLLVSEDFHDGNYTADPTWTVGEGRFWLEPGWGLRSTPTAAAAQAEQPERKMTREEKALAIMGALLGKGGGQDQGGSQPSAAESSVAAIYTPAPITNPFAIEVEFSSWQAKGRLEIGPYQGQDRVAGYRLAYVPGGALQLLRVTARGTAVVDSFPGPVSLEDKQVHRIDWNRYPDGAMTVALDGKDVIKVTDRSFRDPFTGIVLVNQGGDFVLRRLAVYGTQ